MKYSILIIATILIAQIGAAQSIQGIIFDKETGELLPFAPVILYEDSIQIAGVRTSIEGEYSFDDIAPGIYDVETVYVGYLRGQIGKIVVEEGVVKADIEMEIDENGIDLSEVEISNLYIPLIRRDETLNGETLPAKEGVIKGKVFDEKTKGELPFADVVLLQNGIQTVVTMSDFSGKYIFYGLKPGEYDVEAVYVGYPNSRITGILVEDNTIPLDISMNESDKFIPIEVNVRTLTIPIIRMDETSTGTTWKAKGIKRFPGF